MGLWKCLRFDLLEQYRGHFMIVARKLCLQWWMQRRQRRLYFLLPFRWMKNAHSRFIRLVMRDISISFHSFLWKNAFCRLSASLSLGTVRPVLSICFCLVDCYLLRNISLSIFCDWKDHKKIPSLYMKGWKLQIFAYFSIVYTLFTCFGRQISLFCLETSGLR